MVCAVNINIIIGYWFIFIYNSEKFPKNILAIWHKNDYNAGNVLMSSDFFKPTAAAGCKKDSGFEK